MPLTNKYAELIALLETLKVADLDIKDQEQQLSIQGMVASADAKHKAWDLANRIDPNFLSEDLSLLLTVQSTDDLKKASINCPDEPNVSVRLGPGVNLPAVATVQDGETVDVLGLTNQNWVLIKTSAGHEGYCYIDFLKV